MNKALLIQYMIEQGIIPSKKSTGIYTQVLNTVTAQVAENTASDSATASQVSENTNKVNTLNTSVQTLTTDLHAVEVKVDANESTIATNTTNITNNKTALEQLAVTVNEHANTLTAVLAKADNLETAQTNLASKESVTAVQSSVIAVADDLHDLSTEVTDYKSSTNATLETHTADITDLQSAVSSLETLKADVELVNDNAQKINEHAAQYDELVTVVQGIQSIKADVETVQAAKADIQTNLNNITANTNAIADLTTRTTTAETNITTLQNDVNTLNTDITSVSEELSAYKSSTDDKVEAVQNRATQVESFVSSQASTLADHASTLSIHSADIIQLKQDVIANKNNIEANAAAIVDKAAQSDLEAVQVVAEDAQTIAASHTTAIANNTSAISALQSSVSTKLSIEEFNTAIADYATKNELPDVTPYVAKTTIKGLVSIDGVNAGTPEHNIKTNKDGKVNTAKIWNESDGGGVMFDSRSNQTKSFVGVNDGSDNIDVQLYAKKSYDVTSTEGHNVGARIALNTTGAYYTANKNNGSFTAEDEIATKKDLPSVEGFATETYVDNKVAALSIPSVEGLATETYVDNKVADIVVPSLAGYATEAYVNEKFNSIEVPSLEGLASEEYVTQAIANITLPDHSSYLTANDLAGLVSVKGTNVSSAKHTIVTQKNNKNITAILWNEASGGGSQMKNENAGKISFTGVNNGDGDNEIWVQSYAKDIATNVGVRTTLSTTGFYYTKAQANGTYTSADEVLTKKMLTGLVAIEGTNATSSSHDIVSKENNKNVTARIWNETSGGGAQMKNENVGKISFIGVNNGNGDNEIWVQGYAKNISTNIGTRMTLTTEKMYYTKNQANGTYAAGDEVLTVKDVANKLEASQLSGLVAVNGTNASSAKHSIVTTKNNKTITATLWNEASGGGAQMTNLNVDKVSFVGVNNGDGDNEIWVQQYAKVKSTNVGARTTLSTTGFFYTKNQNNGSYTADDEVLTKRDEASIRAAIDSALLDFRMQLVDAGIATAEQLGLPSNTSEAGAGSGEANGDGPSLDDDI